MRRTKMNINVLAFIDIFFGEKQRVAEIAKRADIRLVAMLWAPERKILYRKHSVRLPGPHLKWS